VSPDEPPKTLSVDERLALLERVEQREAGAVRKAAGIAWLSLALAATLVGVLIFGAWWQVTRLRAEAEALEQQQSTLLESIETQKAALARVDAEVQQKQAALATIISAYRRTDERARDGLETALDADPKATVLVPRAYIQIVDAADRQWATNLSDRLQNAGVIPVGIEHVPRASDLKRFEVRYYKKAEEPGARRILEALERAGVPAVTHYLNLETNQRVRDNHFEIWCPANARQFKLQPPAKASG
jgi:uncharacterized protein YoxC